jgi:hypothetical protein
VFSDAWEDRIREEAVGMAEKVSSLLENKDDNAAYGVDGRVIGEKHNTRGVGIVGGEYMGGKQTTSREGRLRRDDETGFEKPQSTDGGVDTHHHMPTWASAVLASLNPQRLGTCCAFPKSRPPCFISQLVTVCPYIAQYTADTLFYW